MEVTRRDAVAGFAMVAGCLNRDVFLKRQIYVLFNFLFIIYISSWANE
jgi:hypothetical protein